VRCGDAEKGDNVRIFILDDDPKRQQAFSDYYINRYPSCTLYQSYTADEAIDLLLTQEPFDVVQLDHDLGGKVFQPSGTGTGYEVANAFAEAWGAKKHGRVIVHSFNGHGALQMLSCFVAKGIPCEYRPFGVWDEGEK